MRILTCIGFSVQLAALWLGQKFRYQIAILKYLNYPQLIQSSMELFDSQSLMCQVLSNVASCEKLLLSQEGLSLYKALFQLFPKILELLPHTQEKARCCK